MSDKVATDDTLLGKGLRVIYNMPETNSIGFSEMVANFQTIDNSINNIFRLWNRNRWISDEL